MRHRCKVRVEIFKRRSEGCLSTRELVVYMNKLSVDVVKVGSHSILKTFGQVCARKWESQHGHARPKSLLQCVMTCINTTKSTAIQQN